MMEANGIGGSAADGSQSHQTVIRLEARENGEGSNAEPNVTRPEV